MVRAIEPADLDWVLALNRGHETELSPLDRPGLDRLIGAAFLVRVADPEAALLIAFDQDAAYDSPNFLWFRARLSRFVYVDRVVVAAAARGRGLARSLYTVLFQSARDAGHERIVCEVNSDPPNPGSEAFHTALGFDEIGTARLENGKTVRYLAKSLAD